MQDKGREISFHGQSKLIFLIFLTSHVNEEVHILSVMLDLIRVTPILRNRLLSESTTMSVLTDLIAESLRNAVSSSATDGTVLHDEWKEAEGGMPRTLNMKKV